jgi:hypothetical protein
MRSVPTVVTTGTIDAGTGGTWVALNNSSVYQFTTNSIQSGATWNATAEL